MYEARDKKMSVIVKMEHVTKQFGGLTAVNDFSGEIEKNAIVGLIGPNGAGKTTLFNMIANYYHPTSGKIYFKDQDITEARTEDMARMGLAHLPGHKAVRRHDRAAEHHGRRVPAHHQRQAGGAEGA